MQKNCGQSFELTFDEIQNIAGIPIDHSFLKYKRELTEYGYEVGKVSMKKQVVTFIKSQKQNDTLLLYIHGKGGNAHADLREKGTIETNFGETISWAYLSYVRSHPVRWNVLTKILYGEQDHLTSKEFPQSIGVLTILCVWALAAIMYIRVKKQAKYL